MVSLLLLLLLFVVVGVHANEVRKFLCKQQPRNCFALLVPTTRLCYQNEESSSYVL